MSNAPTSSSTFVQKNVHLRVRVMYRTRPISEVELALGDGVSKQCQFLSLLVYSCTFPVHKRVFRYLYVRMILSKKKKRDFSRKGLEIDKFIQFHSILSEFHFFVIFYVRVEISLSDFSIFLMNITIGMRDEN